MDSETRPDSFKSSFLQECGDLGESYIDIHVEEDSEEDTEEDISNFQPSLTENQGLPSSDNWQDLLEWLHNKLKYHFSMGDIVKSLQFIIDGEGEDDIEDGGQVFETASASRSLSKEEDKKEAAYEIEKKVIKKKKKKKKKNGRETITKNLK